MHQSGSFDLLLKVYFPTERFPKGGILTQQLNDLQIGQQVKVSFPPSKYTYLSKGCFRVNETGEIRKYSKFSMACGGSGITPMYQFITHALDEKGTFNLFLLFANKTEGDILLREELDALHASRKIHLNYALDNGSEGWKGYTGFVSDVMLRESFPVPADDHLLMICGPPLMVRDLLGIAAKLGFKENNIAVF